MDFKEYAKQRLLKEAYGDDNSEENLGLKNSKAMEDISKDNSQDPPTEDEEMEEAQDSELEEEVFALQSQCDNVMKALEVLKKMLNEGPEWALNKVSSLTNQFSKFQQNLTRDEKNTKKEGGYVRTKEEVSPNGGNNELKKESFVESLSINESSAYADYFIKSTKDDIEHALQAIKNTDNKSLYDSMVNYIHKRLDSRINASNADVDTFRKALESSSNDKKQSKWYQSAIESHKKIVGNLSSLKDSIKIPPFKGSVKESFDPMLKTAIGILDYVPKPIATRDVSFLGDALKYL